MRPFLHALPVFVSVIVALSPSVHGFDTGHHWEVTSQVLREFGFDDESRQTACVSNWMLDYYSSSPTGSKKIREELSKLHCDNLFDAAAGTHYMRQFEWNSRQALLEMISRGATDREVMMMLGSILHVVQDLYSHSNWPEIYSAPGVLTPKTWHALNGRMPTSFLTGAYHPPHYIEEEPPHDHPLHGSYSDGIHKDNHERDYWEQAYFLAYYATYEFVSAFRSWTTEARWNQLRMMRQPPGAKWELNGDIRAAYGISLWIDVAGEHGHWKGGESGHKAMFLKSAVSFIARSSRNARWYRMRKGYRPLIGGLYDRKKDSVIPNRAGVEPLSLERRVLVLEVKSMKEIGPSLDQGMFGRPDYYLSGGAFYGRPTPKNESRAFRPVQEPDPPLEGEIISLFRDRVIQESRISEDQWKVMVIADNEKLKQHNFETAISFTVGEEDPGPDDVSDASPLHDTKSLTLIYHWGRRTLKTGRNEYRTGRGRVVSFSGNDKKSVELKMTAYEMPVR